MSGPAILFNLSRLASRLTPAAAMIFLLVLVDVFVSGYLESKMLFRALPGESVAVSGELDYPAGALAKLSYRVPSSHIHLYFTATQGKLWRGRLEVGADARPGEYPVQVYVGTTSVPSDLPVYRVQVFADQSHLNASYKSLTRRFLGLRPLWIVLSASILVIGGLAGSYYLSSCQEQQLASQDIVPIVKMARTRQGWEIHFALGRHHGIRPQDSLLLLDPGFNPAGRIIVDRVDADHSMALVPLTTTIAPTYWLAKAQD